MSPEVRRRVLTAWTLHENLPRELIGAELVMSEQELTMQRPYPMTGRIDQLYRGTNGLLIPVENKRRRRARVKPEDVVQLSCYAYMLLQGAGGGELRDNIAGYGYVRTQDNGAPTYLRARLLSGTVVDRLYVRWVNLYHGTATNPRFNATEANCRDCVMESLCFVT